MDLSEEDIKDRDNSVTPYLHYMYNYCGLIGRRYQGSGYFCDTCIFITCMFIVDLSEEDIKDPDNSVTLVSSLHVRFLWTYRKKRSRIGIIL